MSLAHLIEELEGQTVSSLSYNLQRPDCVIKIELMTKDVICKDLVPEKLSPEKLFSFKAESLKFMEMTHGCVILKIQK